MWLRSGASQPPHRGQRGHGDEFAAAQVEVTGDVRVAEPNSTSIRSGVAIIGRRGSRAAPPIPVPAPAGPPGCATRRAAATRLHDVAGPDPAVELESAAAREVVTADSDDDQDSQTS